ncbi:MAG: PIN domain-containing protein [Sulfuricurvum sp.]|uniref:type II toxin-antitoxin system VapC family toxin n=1 Tax=Sulfuricurvum sp. TaxID=2025608 RepID=UPI00261CCE74|nr:PIN domain-containing protein [Sulfuricurvum sp.]MDD2828625.1 PIN domain-containing protein [Sulfuricurvum sp.]MDD4948302.1 PIN domain-containing protein [Sulfuricurvum sp.]
MFKRLFLDANILVDFVDDTRISHIQSKKIIIDSLQRNVHLFTSCDIVTTVYYLSAKKDKKQALNEITKINRFCKIIDFSNNEVEETCALMAQNSYFKDLEDTIQYILAKKALCDCIISNDQRFYSPDILLLSSEQFCERLGL